MSCTSSRALRKKGPMKRTEPSRTCGSSLTAAVTSDLAAPPLRLPARSCSFPALIMLENVSGHRWGFQRGTLPFRLPLMKAVFSSPRTRSLFRSWEHSAAANPVTKQTEFLFFPFMSKHCSLIPTIWSLKCHLTAWKRGCKRLAVVCCSSYWWVRSKWSLLLFLCWLLLPNSAHLTFINLNQENMETTRL